MSAIFDKEVNKGKNSSPTYPRSREPVNSARNEQDRYRAARCHSGVCGESVVGGRELWGCRQGLRTTCVTEGQWSESCTHTCTHTHTGTQAHRHTHTGTYTYERSSAATWGFEYCLLSFVDFLPAFLGFSGGGEGQLVGEAVWGPAGQLPRLHPACG